jgi:hypothetical protein
MNPPPVAKARFPRVWRPRKSGQKPPCIIQLSADLRRPPPVDIAPAMNIESFQSVRREDLRPFRTRNSRCNAKRG